MQGLPQYMGPEAEQGEDDAVFSWRGLSPTTSQDAED